MPEFIADTDGTVHGLEWSDLASFTQGYIEAMLFTETSCIPMVEWEDPESQERLEEGTADGNIPMDAGFGDIHPDTFDRIQADCIAFEHQAAVALGLSSLAQLRNDRDYTMAQAGRDFWFTRNGHGVGFWDRQELDEDGFGEALSKIAKGFGETWASFNPDPASPTGYGYIWLD